MKQCYEIVPELENLVSHALCYDDIYFREGYAYKDLGLLAENRILNVEKDEISEILVVDIGESSLSSDPECVNYM